MDKRIKQRQLLPSHEGFARYIRSMTPVLACLCLVGVFLYCFYPNNDGLNMRTNSPDVAQNIVGPYRTALHQFKISRIIVPDDCLQPTIDDEWAAACALVTRQGATEKVGVGVVGAPPLAFWLEMDPSGALTVRLNQEPDDPKAAAQMISRELDGVLRSVREEVPSG